jgi:hypothetical protein
LLKSAPASIGTPAIELAGCWGSFCVVSEALIKCALEAPSEGPVLLIRLTVARVRRQQRHAVDVVGP